MLDSTLIILDLAIVVQITLYTDGSCDIHAENQPGGWAAILRAQDEAGQLLREKVLSGGAEQTTNNQMELRAVIEGLKALKQPARLTVCTDSRYVITIAAGKSKASKNKALWQRFRQASRKHTIEWRYIKGHAGDPLNERCDRLAVAEKKKRARASSQAAADVLPATEYSIEIYLSTQFSGKLKAAGWGALIAENGSIRELSGCLPGSSEMETTLIGAIRCLQALPQGGSAIVYTAQEYLAKGMNAWLPNWQARNWKTRQGEPVKYREHWQTLQHLAQVHKVAFHFDRAHREAPQFARGKRLAASALEQA